MSRDNFPRLSAEEAAELIPHDCLIGFSGFTSAGAAKAVPLALAERAKRIHAKGEPFTVRVLTGASTGEDLDEALASANAISWRAPYQSSKTLRKQLNSGEVEFVDMHLSHLPQAVLEGFFGQMGFAVVEATDVTPDGRVYLSTSVGASPTWLEYADKIIIELNSAHSPRLAEMMDIASIPLPPHRNPIPLFHSMGRMGVPFVSVDPSKIVGVVKTDQLDDGTEFAAPDVQSSKIADHIVEFLVKEMKLGNIPKDFLPIQSGVGNIGNAFMKGLGEASQIPPFYMFSEVIQDSQLDMLESGKLLGASTSAIAVSQAKLRDLYEKMDYFTPKIVLRPQEISNNPGIVRRLGVITTNTALEVDLYGHANSTHVAGMKMMNGIGGSGDFTRNAYISIYMCPSTAKGGKISTIVPMCPHVDHNEHSVQIVVTEQGVADLRGKSPSQRATLLIENCAHPDYRPYLRDYIASAGPGHIRHNLERAFELHVNLMKTGAMLPNGG